MPEKKVRDRARRDAREGKAPTTQAGEYIREEMHHIRAGKHGARSAKQAIAIGLSKARRGGVDLPPPAPGEASEETRHSAKLAYEKGQKKDTRRPNPKRSHAVLKVLEHEGHAAASHKALSRQAHQAASTHTHAERSAAAKKASRTKGPRERSAAAKKAARTRAVK